MPASSWREAITQVLKESGEPLHYGEITNRILSQGLYNTDGATPAATVNAVINDSIKKEPNSPFIRVRMGEYMLKATPAVQKEQLEVAEEQAPVFRAFGMYWERSLVDWKGTPALWGKQNEKASKVDFAKQNGVYVLYDGHRPIYIGRAIAESLGTRLLLHTKGRMSARWNRFSWFGLLDVASDGTLGPKPTQLGSEQVITAMESLLIEVLETPLNRRRGDDIGGFEFLQEEAPELAETKLLQGLERLVKSAKG